MPSGRTHLKIEMIGLLIGTIAVAVLVVEGRIDAWFGGIFLSAYLFSSFFLSPDLDLHNSRATRRWGIARALWLPYSWVFRHRAVSHHLLFGPLTRIAYLGGSSFSSYGGLVLLQGDPYARYSRRGRSSSRPSAGSTCPIRYTSSSIDWYRSVGTARML